MWLRLKLQVSQARVEKRGKICPVFYSVNIYNTCEFILTRTLFLTHVDVNLKYMYYYYKHKEIGSWRIYCLWFLFDESDLCLNYLRHSFVHTLYIFSQTLQFTYPFTGFTKTGLNKCSQLPPIARSAAGHNANSNSGTKLKHVKPS